MKKIFVLTLSLFLFIFAGISFLTVNASSNITVTVNGIFDNHTEAETQGSYAYGSKLSLAPTIPSGHEFAFWIVNGVVREDLAINHQFTVTNKLNLQAIFNPVGKVAIVFIDSNGEYLGVRYTEPNEAIDISGIPMPVRPGYVHGSPAWVSVYGANNMHDAPENSVFALQYEIDGSIDDVTLNVNGGTGSDTYEFNSVITVEANVPGVGDEFSHWEENGKIVSYLPSYTFSLLKNRTLTAVFQEVAVSKAPLVTMSDDLALRMGYESYYGQYFVPAGYEVLEYGFLASKSSDQLTINSAGVVIAQSSSRNSYFEFVTSFVENEYRSFRAYMVVKQGEGAPTYIYSEVYFRDPMPAGESVVYQTGFEVADGFTAASVYNNNAEVLTGPVDFQWATRYGSPSTTSPLIGAMSLQMRWYRAASGSHTTDPIYTYTNFATEAATKITFFAANATGMNVEVTISVDSGTNWIAPEVFTLTTTSTEYTYNVPAEYQAEDVMFKFTIVVPDPMPTEDGRLYLDNFKIYSQYTGPIHEVLYNVDDVITFELFFDGNLISKPNPTKDFHTFDGWYLDEAFTTPHNNAAITQSITLYAKFITTVYNITYHLNSGTNHIDNPATYTYFDDEIILSNPTRDYYTFDGWYNNVGLTGTPVTSIPTNSSGNITLYAKWIPVSYSITYNLDGGTNNVGNPSSYNVETSTITLLNPSKDGFIFDGWYFDDDFTGEEVEIIELGSNGNKVLYAKWTEIVGTSYTVTFDSKGGSAVTEQIVLENGFATEPVAPTKSGYAFDGWYTSSDSGVTLENLFDFEGTAVTGNITLYSKWLTIAYYTGFEDVTSAAVYTVTSFTSSSQDWTSSTLRISNNTNFTGWKGNGSIAAALRNGAAHMQTEFTVSDLYSVNLYYARYGTDSGTSFQIFVSTDKVTWIAVSPIILGTDNLTLHSQIIDYSNIDIINAGITTASSLYIRIKHTGLGSGSNNNRLMIDDISFLTDPE